MQTWDEIGKKQQDTLADKMHSIAGYKTLGLISPVSSVQDEGGLLKYKTFWQITAVSATVEEWSPVSRRPSKCDS